MTTKRFIALVVILVLAAGLFVAFTTQPWDRSDSATSVTVYTPGQSITVDKGDQFVIALASNPTTGYSWKAQANDNVEQVKSKFVQGDSKLMGAGGTQLITFEATKRGSTTLQLDDARSFEPGTDPAETESFPVRVG
jgi:inhibitor of cysteine peptidase